MKMPITDNIPPITNSNISSGWNRHRQIFIELHAVDYANTEHDTPSGVYRTYYSINGSPVSYGPNQPDNITSFIVSGQGEIPISFYSVDNLGNTESTKTVIIKLDDVPPVTNCVVEGPDGLNGWYKTNPDISFIATDESSGVLKTYYRFNSDSFQEYIPASVFSIPGEGIHQLQYFSEDVAGNVEEVKTVFFKFDYNSPFTQDDSLDDLYREPVTINFFVSDLYSGVDKTYFTIDGSTPTTSSTSGSSVVISDTGFYTIQYFSIDFAGNIETVKSCQIEVLIDTEAPNVYIRESFLINGNKGWYVSSPDISIDAVDLSGIKEIEYKLHPVGKDTTAKYTSTVDISSSVDMSINHYINIEIDQSEEPFEINLRGVIPEQTTIVEIINNINGIVGQVIATQTGSDGNDGSGYITLTSPTAGTGNASSEIKFLQVLSNDITGEVFGLDETSYPHTFTETVVFVPYTNSFNIPYDEYWNIEFYSVDNKDNQSNIFSKLYKLDTEKPISSVINSYEPDGNNGWYVTNPNISIQVADNLSGVFKTYYRWNTDPWIEYFIDDIIQIPSEGVHYLNIYSIDVAGNEETEKIFEYKFDQSSPVTTDDTFNYQGVIFTSKGSGHQQIGEENPTVIGPYTIQTRNLNVVAAPYIYNITKSQEYVLSQITGVNKNELILLPINRNENSDRLDAYNIQLTGLGSFILPNFGNVSKIYNRSSNVYYRIDYELSDLNGNLFLKGDKPINENDILSVDYSFSGVPLSVNDIINLSYAFDNSHDPQPLNSTNYSLIEPIVQPYVIDYDITINLLPIDVFSSVVHTFYTIDGSEPTVDSTQGTSVNLNEPGTYTLKYFSIDSAGNIEPVKTALYDIIIDKHIPALEITTVPPPDGSNGWHVNDFSLNIALWSEDKTNRYNEDVVEISNYLVEAGINDCIDFEETSSVELTAIVLPGLYTGVQLAQEIENALNLAGNSNYIVNLIDDDVSEAQRFEINSDLSGGGGVFKILWATGSNSLTTIAKTIGFSSSNPLYPVQDSIGYSSYSSIYYRFLLSNYFVKSVEDIKTSISNKQLICVEILKGNPGFYNEILVYSPISLPSTINVNQVLKILPGVGGRNYDYLDDKPVSGTLIITKNSVPLIIGVDYGYDSITNKVTIFYVDSYDYKALYSIKDRICVDYTHYIGLDNVKLGLDTATLNITTTIYGDISKFVDLSNDRANFLVTFPSSPSQFFHEEGEHTIYARVFDHNTVLGTGVPKKQSFLYELSFKLDKIAPETTHLPIESGWLKAPVTVDFIAIDNVSGSGIDKTHYTTDGSTPTILSPYGENIIFNVSGVYNLQYFSVDVAGNIESVKIDTTSINVDADPPLTSIYTVPITPDGDNWWFVSQPTIGFTVVDNFSGLGQTFYKIDDGPFIEYTSPFLLSKQGIVSITYYSVDVAGNIEIERVAILKYDSIAPVTTTNVHSVDYVSNHIVSFIVNDESSGLLETYYTTDGTDPDFSSQTGTFIEFNVSADYVLKYFSVDRAGNIESIKTQDIKLDLEYPEVSDFLPTGCIITDSTTEISFRVGDVLSGVDIDSIIVDVDGIVYSTSKNETYFSYAGTPEEYLIRITPITGLLNFQDVEVLRIKNIEDFAGNITPVIEFNLVSPDTTPPWVREVYPAPNVQDVSTNSNVIAYIDDAQSGVDIKSVIITINDIEFKINYRNILEIQYTGIASSAICQVSNKNLFTYIDSVKDISISFYDSNYNTIKKIEQYLNSLPNYTATILDIRFEQKESTLLLNVTDLDILDSNILDLYPPEENQNFSFIERNNGYLVFASPSFSFEHKSIVSVTIAASDYSGNIMDLFSYVFIPHIYATPSIKKRNYLNRVALTYINDIRNNIASNYTRSRSTSFYGHHKAISLELARHLEEIGHLNEDRSYSTLRPQFLYTKLGYMLDVKPSVDFSHNDYRLLLQSLISILFKGSLKTSLESGVALYIGSEIKIIEVVFSKGSDISDQFVFTADLVINDQFKSIDLIALNNNLANIFNLVKPAHVYFIQRFVWSEEFDFQAGCILKWEQDEFGNDVIDQFGNRVPLIALDGFQAAETQSDTAICDRYKYSFNNFIVEDVRHNCLGSLIRIDTYTEDVSYQFSGIENFFYTYRYPLLHDETHVATIVDVFVTVNGVGVTITEINPLTGHIIIGIVPPYGSIVLVTYKYNKYFVYRAVTFILNDFGSIFCHGSSYFNILSSNVNEFIIDSDEEGFIIEKRTNYFENIIGRIQPPEVELHAHICEQDFIAISMSFNVNPYVGYSFPGSIEEDPDIIPDFPEEFKRISDFKEPLMLGSIDGRVTYMNDTRYRLNGTSILNHLWRHQDTPIITLHHRLMYIGNPYVGQEFPGTEEDLKVIADFKEPLMLGDINGSITFLNDIRYRLNASSFINSMWRKHDAAILIFLEELYTLNIGGIYSGYSSSDETYIYKSWTGSSEIRAYNIVSEELIEVANLSTLGFSMTNSIICKEGFLLVNAKDIGLNSNLITLTFNGSFSIVSSTVFPSSQNTNDMCVDVNGYLYAACGTEGLYAFSFNSTTGSTVYIDKFYVPGEFFYSVDCVGEDIFVSFSSYISVLRFNGSIFNEIYRTPQLDPKSYGTSINKLRIFNENFIVAGCFNGTLPINSGYTMLLQFTGSEIVLLDTFDMFEEDTGVMNIAINNEYIFVASSKYFHVFDVTSGEIIEIISQSEYNSYYDIVKTGNYFNISCEKSSNNCFLLFEFLTRRLE